MIISLTTMKIMQETLAEFILRILEETKLSEAEVAKRAGGEISQGYINDIKNSRALPESMTIKKVRALARGLGITEEEMFMRVRGIYRTRNEFSFHISNYVNELPENRQKDLLDIAKLFFTQNGNSDNPDSNHPPKETFTNILNFAPNEVIDRTSGKDLNFSTLGGGDKEETNENLHFSDDETFEPEEDEFGNDPVLDEFIEKHLKDKDE